MDELDNPVLSAMAFIISLALALSFLPMFMKNLTWPGPAPVSPNSSVFCVELPDFSITILSKAAAVSTEL